MLSGGKSSEFGVVGWPLEISYSPVMQQAALDESGLAHRYAAIPVPPAKIEVFVMQAAREMRGINVTIPHKQAVKALCTEVDALGSACGAVNTLVFSPGVIRGYNTDGPGLVRALAEGRGFAPAGKSALIFGAGGSARAAAAQLALSGASVVEVVNRTHDNSVGLCEDLRARFPGTTWTATPLTGAPGSVCADLILSCVPAAHSLQMAPLVTSARRGAVFVDLSYGPDATPLHQVAQHAGLDVVPGLEMLLWQGALAFTIFTGIEAPVLAMRRALTSVVGGWWLSC